MAAVTLQGARHLIFVSQATLLYIIEGSTVKQDTSSYPCALAAALFPNESHMNASLLLTMEEDCRCVLSSPVRFRLSVLPRTGVAFTGTTDEKAEEKEARGEAQSIGRRTPQGTLLPDESFDGYRDSHGSWVCG